MNSVDKILNSINEDCQKNIDTINKDSAKVCEEILAKGREDAQRVKAEIEAKTKQNALQIKAANKSRRELEERNALLRKRRFEIDNTFEAVYKYLLNIEDSKYFDIIFKFLNKCQNKQGIIFLNDNDLKRLPKDFDERLSKSGVDARLSNIPADIDGGFILKYGDIEENMSFSAVMEANRDRIEDKINRELFAE